MTDAARRRLTTDLPFWRPPAPTRKDLRKFGLLFGLLAAVLAAYLVWRRGFDAAVVPAAISAVLLLLSLLLPSLLTPVWWPWMVLARVLGFVNSHLLLALVFYLMFTPIGLLMRLFRRDPLGDRDFARARRTSTDGGSLWLRRDEQQLAPHHFERQF